MGTAGPVSSGGVIMDEQLLAGILAAMPGENPQQRLNYLQDLFKQLNVDPFGTQQPVMQEWQDPLLKYDITYGGNEGYAAVFDAVDSGVDPETAVRGAVADNRFPDVTDMSEQDKQRFISDAQTVARNYAFEKLDAEQGRIGFERRQAQTAAEAPRPLSSLMPTTAYDQAVERLGFEPTAQDLMDAYSRQLWEQQGTAPRAQKRRTGSTAGRDTKETSGDSVSAGDFVKSAARGLGSFLGGLPVPANIVRNVVSDMPMVRGITGSGIRRRPAMPDMSGLTEDQARSAVRAGAQAVRNVLPFAGEDKMPEGFGFSGRYGDVKKQMFEAAADRAAAAAKRRTVQTPQSQQFMQNLAYALLLQGD